MIEGVRLSNLLVCQFSMVATIDTTIPPKLIIIHGTNENNVHVVVTQYFANMISKNNWMIRERKKRRGPIASNQLILNTCHSTSTANATTTLATTSVPTIAVFWHFSPSPFDHRVDLHLSNISCSCAGFKYMNRCNISYCLDTNYKCCYTTPTI